jgi:hypothetical protein
LSITLCIRELPSRLTRFAFIVAKGLGEIVHADAIAFAVDEGVLFLEVFSVRAARLKLCGR